MRQQTLVNYVQNIAGQSGNRQDFDAEAWVARWLKEPIPALGFRTPMTYLNTDEDLDFLLNLLATSQSGAYA